MTEIADLTKRLAEAMDNGEFEMFYQPSYATHDGKPIAVESLIRWRHPQRGLVPPVVFLALCEESGLILPLGRWILGEACACHYRLAEAGWPDVAVSVNISASQFQDKGMVDYLRTLVKEFAIPDGALEFELPEALVMDEPVQAAEIMTAVRALGVRVAVGEFGTGYSNLSSLHRAPVDKLKIDRSVVRGVHADPHNAALCRSIISMAHGKSLQVIAEGVEVHEEHDWLRNNGCDGVQGYLLARPAPFDDMLKTLGPLPVQATAETAAGGRHREPNFRVA
jgi:EAL domain-containing protein (putative c-di-GMP-specific phosphodiesterase class I)